MREIRFRAWDGKKMVGPFDMADIAYDWDNEQGDFTIPYPEGQNDGYDEGPWMQYTGIKDVHGKEIYEGDILLIRDFYKEIIVAGEGPTYEFNHLSPVVFKDGSFGCDIRENGMDYKKGFNAFPMMDYEMGAENVLEVIGNIYDGQDLLKEV